MLLFVVWRWRSLARGRGGGFAGALVDPYLQVQVALSADQVRRRHRSGAGDREGGRGRSASRCRGDRRGREEASAAAKDIAAARTAFGEVSTRAASLRGEDEVGLRRPTSGSRIARWPNKPWLTEGQDDSQPVLRRGDARRAAASRMSPVQRRTRMARLRQPVSHRERCRAAGPGTRSSDAHRQPTAPASARQQLDRHHRQQKPEARLQRQRRADVVARRVLADERRELRGVGDHREAPDHRRARRTRPARAPKTTGVSAAQAALVHMAQIATRARPSRSASQPASTQPAVPLPMARNAASEPAAAASATPAAAKLAVGEHGNPRPHRVELPHVAEIAERRQPRAARREDPPDRVGIEGRGRRDVRTVAHDDKTSSAADDGER